MSVVGPKFWASFSIAICWLQDNTNNEIFIKAHLQHENSIWRAAQIFQFEIHIHDETPQVENKNHKKLTQFKSSNAKQARPAMGG